MTEFMLCYSINKGVVNTIGGIWSTYSNHFDSGQIIATRLIKRQLVF